MRDALGPGTTLGYCSNVHPGADLSQTKANLERHAVRVKELCSPSEPLGICLWLSARAAHELVQTKSVTEFKDWLEERGLYVFTMNGFPYGDFHEPIVKHRVYQPNWSDAKRSDYTRDLISILCDLLPESSEGSISTLPIAWPTHHYDVQQAAQSISHVAQKLERIEEKTGKLIHLNLEPEPGCELSASTDAVQFYQDFGDERFSRYIRICHDICHSAVIFEDQTESLNRYRNAGIRIGKVQISSALRVDLRNYSARERIDALHQLRAFSEDRYLHQTMVQSGKEMNFFDDLPKAFNAFGTSDRAGDEWRVHFHVPVFLESFGMLKTTRDEISEFLSAIEPEDEIHHFEVETYAWNVLPTELKTNDLASGIARELQWVKDVAK